jgi:protease I
MNRSAYAFIPLLVLLTLVACTPNPAPATPANNENPTTMPPTATSIPSVKPTSTPEPTPTLTPTPIPPTSEPEPTPWQPQRPDQPCEPSGSKTCNLLYILADQYDDEHILKTCHHFETAGYTTHVASNTLDVVHGFHECYEFTPAYPDLLLEDVDVANYDAILFVGSDGVSIDLHNDPLAHRIAQDALEQGKVIVAVGDGPVILAKAGLLEGRTATVLRNISWYAVGDQWFNAIVRQGAIYHWCGTAC